MLAHNYLDSVDKIQLFIGPNYAYPMTNNNLLTGFLLWQIFTVVLFISKDFSATVSTVDEEAMSHQTHNQNTEIKEAIHRISTISLHSYSCVQILSWVSEPDQPN